MWWARPVGWILDNVAYRTRVFGADNVPRNVPVLFAGNHLSYLDGPVMFGASPVPMHILVKQEMFSGFLGGVLRGSGQIPVDRTHGREALNTAKALLDAGRNVGILPEGTRGSGTAVSLNNGVAWLALHTDAVVVPVGITGTRRAGEHVDHVPKPGRQFAVSFGEPLRAARRAGESGRASMDRTAEEIRQALVVEVAGVVQRSGLELPEGSVDAAVTGR
ncbi:MULTISPECIES: lysophospholipid acyltransferase family protein [Arthrobacter]|uniref:Lysophospholipid acyltransferase family protein n=2 Tax=Arthrobacter TaxID=1663 RepID=A0ABU9KRL6_9MICC|nr:lysophospholipid acyltransferase family protein [Arthrobacter sp. YJM1]MDP5228483.1 lysophospholipid acyltransferase family protein [Arthrobacter sp. YJM1]